MRRFAKHIMLCATLCYSLLSCDVHQWPENPIEKVDLNISLEFETDMPILDIIDRISPYASTNPDDYDIRYLINAYRISDNGTVSTTPSEEWVFSKPDVSELEFKAALRIAPGKYRIHAWVDYVDNDKKSDKFYQTSDFSSVRLFDGVHIGNNDFRDAFIGSTDVDVVPQFELNLPPIEANIVMGRPLAKFNFISNDLNEFISRVLEMRARQAAVDGVTLPESEMLPSSVDLSEFRIEIRYSGFMPCEFNLFTNIPVDSRTGVKFDSKINPINGDEALLGFDYVFVNGQRSTVLVSISVYNKAGELLSAVSNIEVPVERSKLTTIRSSFMTESAEGGVGIDSEFEDEFNIFI